MNKSFELLRIYVCIPVSLACENFNTQNSLLKSAIKVKVMFQFFHLYVNTNNNNSNIQMQCDDGRRFCLNLSWLN